MTKTLPLVRQLQAEAIDPDVPVSKLLRLAKVIATKLNQEDALKWINGELDGYMDGVATDVPQYRLLGGQPKGYNPYHGWQTIQFEDAKTAKTFSTVPLGQSIGSLEKDLTKGDRGSFIFAYPPEMAKAVRESIHFPVEVAVFLSEGSLWGIVEAVRNLVLNWSLDLEKAGILGAEMTFTAEEREQAAPVTQQFFIQNVGVLGHVSDNAKVKNKQSATVTINAKDAERFAKQAFAAFGQLPSGVKPQLAPVLNEIRREASKEKPEQSKLRDLLVSARSIAEQAAGNLAASGIIAAIGKLLGA
jgi:hypothetical protein